MEAHPLRRALFLPIDATGSSRFLAYRMALSPRSPALRIVPTLLCKERRRNVAAVRRQAPRPPPIHHPQFYVPRACLRAMLHSGKTRQKLPVGDDPQGRFWPPNR
jgi:hypothetical protein